MLPRATISFIFCLDNYNDLSPSIPSAFSCNLYYLPYSFVWCLSHLLHHLLLSCLLSTLQAHLSLIYFYQRFQHSKHVPSLMVLMIFSLVRCMAGSFSSSKSISNFTLTNGSVYLKWQPNYQLQLPFNFYHITFIRLFTVFPCKNLSSIRVKTFYIWIIAEFPMHGT